LGRGFFFVQHRIVSAVKTVELVSNRSSYTYSSVMPLF
jgi:hypothetical protein